MRLGSHFAVVLAALLLSGAVAGSAVAAPARPGGSGGGGELVSPPPVGLPAAPPQGVDRRAWDAVQEKRAQRQGAGARLRRLQSRLAFSRVDLARARGLSKSVFPELLAQSPREALDLSGGARVVEWVGDNAARVRDGSRESLAVSTLPLRASTGGEGLRAVDHRMVARDGGFEAVNPNVRVRAGGRLADGFGLPDSGVGIVPVAAPGAAPSPAVVDGRVSWVDIAPDTDLWLEAIPGGLRTFHVLRSERAPERLELDLRLPAGARLEDKPEGVVVTDAAGKGLAVIGRPWARDADGEPVEVSLSLEGRRVVLAVAHRGKDVQYPLVVDPPAVDFQYWYGNDDVNGPFRTWSYWSNNPAGFTGGAGSGWIDNQAYARGLYVWNRGAKWYGVGQVGQWAYGSYRESFVYRMDLAGIHHRPEATCLYRGLVNARAGVWQSAYYYGPYNASSPVWWCQYEYSVAETHCAAADCAPDGPVGNVGVWGLQTYGYDGARSNFTGYVGAATMYLSDYNDPTISADVAPPTGWTQGDQYLQFRGTDPGLGMKRVRLSAPATPGWSNAVDYDTGCTFGVNNRCGDTAWVYSYLNGLPDGIQTLRAEGWDIIDRYSVRDWPVKIDRSPPTLSVTGDLRSLAGSLDDSGRDLYGLVVTARDGVPGGPDVDQRIGVATVKVFIDNTEVATAGSDPDCVQSCAVTIDDYYLDTDTLGEGSHPIKVVATDRSGQSSDQSWVITVPGEDYYSGQLASWRSDIERRVDSTLPAVPLSGPMPTPPVDWRTPEACEASETAMGNCYDAVLQWGRDVRTWLQQNGVIATGDALPDPPTFDYARAVATSLDLTRRARDAFRLAKRPLTSPASLVNVAIGFHGPITSGELSALLPGLALQEQVAFTGIFDPGGADIQGSRTFVTLATLQANLETFYQEQLGIAEADIARFQQTPVEDAEDVEDIDRALNDLQAFRAHMVGRRAFVKGVALRLSLPVLLDVLSSTAASDVIKTAQLLPDAAALSDIGDYTLGGDMTDAGAVAAAREGPVDGGGGGGEGGPGTTRAGSTASVASEQTCVQRGERGRMGSKVVRPNPAYFSPSRFDLDTELGSPDGDGRQKVHQLNFRWQSRNSLWWMCGDSPGDRNVEVEAMVYPEDPRWSDNWEANNVHKYTQTNLPETLHQDDIASGDDPFQFPPGYPFDKARYPDFAIISQASQSFRYRKIYRVRFVTNEGFTTQGRVIYSVQATRRAAGAAEQSYCTARFRDYKSCMFSETTACVGYRDISDGRFFRRIGWADFLGYLQGIPSDGRFYSPNDVQGYKVVTFCDPRPPGSGQS